MPDANKLEQGQPPVPRTATQPNRASLRTIAAEATTAAPYGADKLENTDFSKLKTSLLRQMDQAGIPRPEIMELHPSPGWKEPKSSRNINPNGYSDDRVIVGNATPNLTQLDRTDFNKHFPNAPVCDGKVNSFNDADTALHETAHYVAYHRFKSDSDKARGADLNGYVFSAINQTGPAQNPQSYYQSLQEDAQFFSGLHGAVDKNAEQIAVARGTKLQIPERIADASATLYALSNYSDTSAVKEYYQNLAAYRKANSFRDGDHATSSSITAALEAFSKNHRKGMTIVETTDMAGEIVKNDPALNQTIEALAQELKNQQRVTDAFKKNPKNPYQSILDSNPNMSAEDKIRAKKAVEDITKARNHSCGLGHVS